jgi:hypothetical protein
LLGRVGKKTLIPTILERRVKREIALLFSALRLGKFSLLLRRQEEKLELIDTVLISFFWVIRRLREAIIGEELKIEIATIFLEV